MFTGLVECLAKVLRVVEEPPGRRITLAAGEFAAGIAVGESIAVSGCCLTAIANDADMLSFQAGPETLLKSSLGRLTVGSVVNLERSLRLGDRLGGHWVSGHVDGVGHIHFREESGEWCSLWIDAPGELLRQMAPKGSIAVDGVSLTLVDVTDQRFSVALIPHTLSSTTLGVLRAGDAVNLETDLLAKYVARQLASGNQVTPLG